jgi:hypothetical protein
METTDTHIETFAGSGSSGSSGGRCNGTEPKCDIFGEDVNCCYDLLTKIDEFLQKDTYMLDYTNVIKKEENADRMKVLYSKLFQPYSVLPHKKIDKDYNGKYLNTFGIIPLELIPASYIPFNYKNYDMNLDRLTKGDLFYEDDYKKIFIDYNKQPDPNNTDYFNEKVGLKDYLQLCLKDKLNNPKAIYNAYSIMTMTVIVCVIWFVVVVMMLYILFYYYRNIYSYILIFIIALLVLIAIVWKMIYILNMD